MIQIRPKVLYVEDDEALGYATTYFLEQNGYDVTHCINGETAWSKFMKYSYDICLFDILLPSRKNGLNLTNEVREKNETIPIILISSKGMDEDRILGLESGADCYLTKPVNFNELLKRVEVFLKRNKKKDHSPIVHFKIGDLDFDYLKLTLGKSDFGYKLTQREADLLRYMCLNPDRLIKREDILMELWGKDDYYLGRSLDVFINKLRKYIRSQNKVKILTIHGLGFMYSIEGKLEENIITNYIY